MAAAACIPPRPPAVPRAIAPLVHLGPERTSIAYDDPGAAAKRVLFDRINRDRAAHGVAPVAWDPRAALVGDAFALDAALSGSRGHWDTRGRAPYLRWALAGGVDYHVQNAGMYSVSAGRIGRPPADILLAIHDSMMAERPPMDGHRRTILDPAHTHVGIGLAVAGTELRMSQEFTRVAFEWIEIPARSLSEDEWAAFRGRPLPEWELGLVEIRYEPPPRPMSIEETRRRVTYGYPRVVRTLVPRLAEGLAYVDGAVGEVEVEDGVIAFEFPLDQGPGHYYVLCHVHPAGRPRDAMRPATAALVTGG